MSAFTRDNGPQPDTKTVQATPDPAELANRIANARRRRMALGGTQSTFVSRAMPSFSTDAGVTNPTLNGQA